MVKRLKYSCVPVGTGLWIIEAQDTFRRHPMNQKAKSNEEDFAFLVILSVLVDKAVECRNVIARNRFLQGPTHTQTELTHGPMALQAGLGSLQASLLLWHAL